MKTTLQLKTLFFYWLKKVRKNFLLSDYRKLLAFRIEIAVPKKTFKYTKMNMIDIGGKRHLVSLGKRMLVFRKVKKKVSMPAISLYLMALLRI